MPDDTKFPLLTPREEAKLRERDTPDVKGKLSPRPADRIGKRWPDGPNERVDEAVAEAFHEAYERLAPDFGYRTREASAKPWREVPIENRMLMAAVARDLRDQGVIR